MIKLAKILDIDAAKVTLKLEKKTQCSDCKSRCSNGFLSFLFNKNSEGILSVSLSDNYKQVSHLEDEKHFFNQKHKINDVIGLKFSESELFKMALMLYGIPIIIVVTMLVIGFYLFRFMNMSPDFGGIIGILSGLLISKVIIQVNNHKIKPKVSFFN